MKSRRTSRRFQKGFKSEEKMPIKLIPTIEVKLRKSGLKVVINESDFDSTIHQEIHKGNDGDGGGGFHKIEIPDNKPDEDDKQKKKPDKKKHAED